MGSHILLMLLSLSVVSPTVGLMCLEGADCVRDASCGECSGVACTRVTSYNMEDNREIALTCLPYDTRSYQFHHLEPEGCRQLGDRQFCVCYTEDYCNFSNQTFRFKFLLALIVLVIIL